MDDIDTRLEAERPEVADALRSMNWEERLEQARARRKAVLTRNEAAEKRPVVRIIDAQAVARKRSEPAPAERAVPRAPVVLQPTAPKPAQEPETTPVPLSEGTADPPAEPDRRSVAARTALGFGLGVGLGTSLIAGAYLLMAPPGEGPAPRSATATETAAVAAVVPGPTPALPAPEPAQIAAVPAPPSAAPVVPAGPPVAIVAPLLPAATAAAQVPVEIAALPAARPQPAMPAAALPDPAAASADPPAVAVLASLDIGLRNPSETASAAVPVPAQRREIPRPLPARIDTGGTATGAAPAPDASPTRPAAALAMAALTDASPAPASLVVPGGLSSVVPVAFPWPPDGPSGPDALPNAALSPPPPPAPPPAAEEPGLPGAEALFVRLAVPQTVPEAEAEEIASLLREIGVGDSRVTRVGFKVSETHVRFYRPADAPAAAALAEMLGTEARDHSTFRPRPPDGTLEVFLAGERTAPPPRVSTSRTTRRQPPDELTRMRDRIVNRLRRGEHL